MKKVQIRCPSCSKIGTIEILEDAMKSAPRGLLAVNIAKDILCPHNFIAYIDKNLNVRDYFISDFSIELPEITQEEKEKIGKIPSKDILDIDLIRINIPATLLTYILRSIFLKQKIVLLFEQEFLYRHISNFFKYISQGSFNVDMTIIAHDQYKNNKKDYKDSIVFDYLTIVKNNKKLINPKKLHIEKQIVSRFMTEGDLGYSYIVLRNDIQRAFNYAKSIVDILKNSNKDIQRNILKICVELERRHNFKINTMYLSFLTEIVEYYFGVKLPSITDSFLYA